MNVRPATLAALFFSLAVLAARADTVPQCIARARAYLGTESALTAVTSIAYTGTLEGVERVPSPEDKTKLIERPAKVSTKIIFQKPYRQRIMLTRPNTIEITALDGYDGWSKTINAANPADWRVRLLDARQIKTLRANTWENLYFYGGIEKKGGTVEMGPESVEDGVACVRLNFVHDANNTFARFFDKATGRLVKTLTENGTEIHEDGEIVVNGVRFPKKIFQKAPNGQVTTINFDQVEVNQNAPDSDFVVPSLVPVN